jgi:hypothetical protein
MTQEREALLKTDPMCMLDLPGQCGHMCSWVP